jgi:hypothetical protein
MLERLDLLGRLRRRIPRDSALARVFDPLHWMLHTNRGAVFPTLRYVRHHGLTVKGGPFAGLRYPSSALVQVPGLVSHLAGTYELELHRAVEELVSRGPSLIVNVGAGDGYYAVGLALRRPEARVLAFEADPYHARNLSDLARENGVADRIEVRGACDLETLAGLDAPAGTAVLCDCEGCEQELIDPERVEWLRRCPLLVEAHESFTPGIEDELRQRLENSHALTTIHPGKRYMEDHPLFWETPGVSPLQLESLMSELRPWRTPWIWAVPL